MITRAALIGLGTMGPGIAGRLARGGIAVMAYDQSVAAVERSRAMLATVNGVLDSLEIAPPGKQAGQVRFASSLAEAVADAELVIENVPENIDIKAEVYRAIDPLIGPSVIVASDTSGIPISWSVTHFESAWVERPYSCSTANCP